MSYKRLGNYIQQVNIRNKDLETDILLGVSITKKLIPSIANVIGTDMSVYKIIEKRQFAYGTVTSRNGDKISIALADQYEKALVSQIYVVFEVIDIEELLPEYLMMWFSRPEFDRYVRFHSHGSTRETFDWEDMCEVELPIPSIEEQRQLAAQYQSIANKIKVNEQICEKLEATAQALYKHWFVDFEFPNEAGKPYKSSGGNMVWNEEPGKEIPEGWENTSLSNIVEIKDGTHDSPNPTSTGFPLVTSTHLNLYDISLDKTYNISLEDFNQTNRRSKVDKYDILFSMIGTVGIVNYVLYNEINFAIKNVGLFKTSAKKEISEYILFFLKSDYMKLYLASNPNGSTQNYVTLGFLRNIEILLPSRKIILRFEKKVKILVELIERKVIENQKLTQLQSLLLSQLAVGEEVSA